MTIETSFIFETSLKQHLEIQNQDRSKLENKPKDRNQIYNLNYK